MDFIKEDLYEPRDRYVGRKGIYPVIENYDRIFQQLNTEPIMADEMDLTTEHGQQFFNEMVYSRYEGDVFTNVPKCPCGHLHGGDEEGERCSKCGYECKSPTEQVIEPLVWIRPPEGVDYFMNPQVYTILSKALKTSDGFNALDYILDPKYKGPRLNSIFESMLKEEDIPRGMSQIRENFIDILEHMFTLRRVTHVNGKRVSHSIVAPKNGREILKFVELVQDDMFSRVLPFPSKIGFIIENVGSMKYIDPEMRPALNAMISIAKANRECKTLEDADSRVARSVRDLATYYQQTESKKIFPKDGVFRKLVYGTTPHFTFRTVITSEHLPHDHETLRIPWGAAVMLFKLHIGNKLLKEGYTPNAWLSLIYDNVQRKHYKLDKIFDELIAESPGGRGPACLFTRFPSLKHNSSTRFFINIKRDPRHMSTSLSLLTIRAPNADFDGDYMSGQLALDNEQAEVFGRHAPYTGLMDHKVPHMVSDHPQLPGPLISTINNRLEITDELCKPIE